MRPERPELADIVREYGNDYAHLHPLSREQERVLHDLARCRSAALGGHKRVCDRCGHEQIAYNSCRNRHCPKCQGMARRSWLAARAGDLLDVSYFHVVFTLPHELSSLARQNRRLVYGLLFRAVSRTLMQIAEDPKHLGAQVGFLAVLHTWGQKLDHHPHIHCVVPGGGISADGSRWIPCRARFFLPVKVLSRLLRRKMIAYLRQAAVNHSLRLNGELADPKAWQRLLQRLAHKEWVVYAKPPFGGPTQVLKYLARYTHRVAISDSRLVALQDGRVSFRYKDYRDENRERMMTLAAPEFIRRFLMHLLPNGFMHIRHYGWLANCVRRKKLVRCRTLIGMEVEQRQKTADIAGEHENDVASAEDNVLRCPVCSEGRMVIVVRISPDPKHLCALTLTSAGSDTS